MREKFVVGVPADDPPHPGRMRAVRTEKMSTQMAANRWLSELMPRSYKQGH